MGMNTPTGNVKLYNRISHTSTAVFLVDFVAFLIDDEGSSFITGLNKSWLTTNGGTGGSTWKMVEAYSSAASTNRQTPPTTSGNNALDSFTGTGFSWKTGSLLAGDWIVLECGGTNPFHIYIELNSTTQIGYKFMPLGDFSTGGSAVSPPVSPNGFSATAIPGGGSSSSLNAQTGYTSTVYYTGDAADRFFSFHINLATFMYIGETNQGASADTRPYVMYTDSDNLRWDMITASQWSRLSPVDNATELTAGSNVQMFNVADLGNRVHYGDVIDATGEFRILPVGVFFDDTNHNHFAGWLVGVGSAPRDGVLSVTSGTANQADRGDDTGDGIGPNSGGEENFIFTSDLNTAPGVMHFWDGSSTFP